VSRRKWKTWRAMAAPLSATLRHSRQGWHSALFPFTSRPSSSRQTCCCEDGDDGEDEREEAGSVAGSGPAAGAAESGRAAAERGRHCRRSVLFFFLTPMLLAGRPLAGRALPLHPGPLSFTLECLFTGSKATLSPTNATSSRRAVAVAAGCATRADDDAGPPAADAARAAPGAIISQQQGGKRKRKTHAEDSHQRCLFLASRSSPSLSRSLAQTGCEVGGCFGMM